MPPRARPPWWPADEPWPPARWRGGRWGPWSGHGPWGTADGEGGRPPWWEARRSGAIRRGFGCLVVLLATLIVSIGVLVLWILAGLLGLASLEGSLADLARPAGLVVLVVGVVALVVGIRVARGVGQPLSDLVDAAGRIEAADYTARVPEDRGRGELRRLSRAFNTMAARLGAEDAGRRRLLADVSHELRTPLAVIQGNLEALVDGVYPPDEAHLRPILEESRILERLVDDLRTLSLAESGALPLHREPTDPTVLLDDVVAGHRAAAAAAGIDLHVDTPAGELPAIEVDPVRMRQVIANLVDNAIRAMPDGGSIRVAARAASESGSGSAQPDRSSGSAEPRPGSGVAFEVVDDGPGIPDELRSTLFERFTKSPTSRGSGLGLAIARAIVEAHGGSIAVAPGAGGRGTRFHIELPPGTVD